MAKDFDIEILRASAAQGRIHWHQHALERFLERGITRAEIISAIMKGEVIEIYPTDRPHPSCLMLHVEPEPVHVVVAADPAVPICHIITAYRPNLEHFEPDFRIRRKKS
jgi:hypothetical protein